MEGVAFPHGVGSGGDWTGLPHAIDQSITTRGRRTSYVVTRLQARTDEIRICPTEIEDARWVPFSQFQQEASHPVRPGLLLPLFWIAFVLLLQHTANSPFSRRSIRPHPSKMTRTEWRQILKTVAQLTAGLDLSRQDDDDEGTAGDIVETEHASILPNRPHYKLYHLPLPS